MSKLTPNQPILKACIEDDTLDLVTDVVFTPAEDGIITVGEDKTIRIWLRRETGRYWPSVCHFLLSPCSVACFSAEKRLLFVGQDNGSIEEFSVSEDYNHIDHVRRYEAHQSQVTGCAFSHLSQVLVACGKDSRITWYWTQSGSRLGEFVAASSLTSLQRYDVQSHYVFSGMSNGDIVVLKIDKDNFSLIATLKGHEEEISSLCWDPIKQTLYSGSSDTTIIAWDIGGKKGNRIQLVGHTQKVTTLSYSPQTSQLFSTSNDKFLVIWDMKVKRMDAPVWDEADVCAKCNQPFFWNLKQMWSKKTLGQRRHHCRKCGAAVCITCASNMITLPKYGFETEVRVCTECHHSTSDEERVPTAKFFDLRHEIISSSSDWPRGWFVTCGSNRAIKLWDIKSVLK